MAKKMCCEKLAKCKGHGADLGAGPEQQAAGPVSNPQQQQQQKSLRASAISSQGLPQ
jgi:hypothetical protein